MGSLLAALAWTVYLIMCLRGERIRKTDLLFPTLVLILMHLEAANNFYFDK